LIYFGRFDYAVFLPNNQKCFLIVFCFEPFWLEIKNGERLALKMKTNEDICFVALPRQNALCMQKPPIYWGISAVLVGQANATIYLTYMGLHTIKSHFDFLYDYADLTIPFDFSVLILRKAS